MAKGLFAGMKDYSIQSFKDLLVDLKKEKEDTERYLSLIEGTLGEVKKTDYWKEKVPSNFHRITGFSIKHYKSTITELEDIIPGLEKEVMPHHIRRLKKIAHVAEDINQKIGVIWHQQYLDKEYGRPEFLKVENIYAEIRDMANSLLDIENIAVRLEDFMGRKHTIEKGRKQLFPSIGLIVAFVGLLITLTGLLFGDNLLERYKLFDSGKIPLIKKDTISSNIQGINSDKLISDDVIYPISLELPYLEPLPILDKGIYLEYYFNDLILSGANIEMIKFNGRQSSGKRLDYEYNQGQVIMNIYNEPYFEISYKGEIYSFEVTRRHSFFHVEIKKLRKTTLELFEIQ